MLKGMYVFGIADSEQQGHPELDVVGLDCLDSIGENMVISDDEGEEKH